MSKARRESVALRTVECKLRNRRVRGGLMADGTIVFRFRRLRRDGTIRGESIRVSLEALHAMVGVANELLTKEEPSE